VIQFNSNEWKCAVCREGKSSQKSCYFIGLCISNLLPPITEQQKTNPFPLLSSV